MNRIVKIFLATFLPFLINGLMTSEYGPVYDHFRKYPLKLTARDLTIIGDAFQSALSHSDQKTQELIKSTQSKIESMMTNVNKIDQTIESTRTLAKFMKSQAESNSQQDTFGRLLTSNSINSVRVLINKIEEKLLQAENHKNNILESITMAKRKLSILTLMPKLIYASHQGWASALGSLFGSERRNLEVKNFKYFPSGLQGAITNFLGLHAAHFEHLSQLDDYTTDQKNNFSAIARNLKQVNSYLNSVKTEKIDFDRIKHNLYDVASKEGTVGKVYVRTVDTLKCILLAQGCPTPNAVSVDHSGSKSQAVFLGDFGEAPQVASTVVDDGVYDKVAKWAPIEKGGNLTDYFNSPTIAAIKPKILVYQGALSIDNAATPNRDSDIKNYEPIIIQNESFIDTLPPITDINSGVLTINPFMNQEVRQSIISSVGLKPNQTATAGQVLGNLQLSSQSFVKTEAESKIPEIISADSTKSAKIISTNQTLNAVSDQGVNVENVENLNTVQNLKIVENFNTVEGENIVDNLASASGN